ncbi:MAG: hypothetical protein C0624_07750 [Desulfuromonas sp.]|nr:MAG: hypothetical protein C0624_07750 [Desulfuromonas sp.]
MRRGSRIPLLLLALFSLWMSSRLLPRHGEPPAFSVYGPPRLQFALSDGSNFPGIHQDFDVFSRRRVNEMANSEVGCFFVEDYQQVNGSEVAFDDAGKLTFVRWLPASQRMALQIPLHPDRMSCEDWQALPGIGPYLAAAIEENRQQNGDFATVESLLRVKGIGEKRLAAFFDYFERP